jgi:hypothetical protein
MAYCRTCWITRPAVNLRFINTGKGCRVKDSESFLLSFPSHSYLLVPVVSRLLGQCAYIIQTLSLSVRQVFLPKLLVLRTTHQLSKPPQPTDELELRYRIYSRFLLTSGLISLRCCSPPGHHFLFSLTGLSLFFSGTCLNVGRDQYGLVS